MTREPFAYGIQAPIGSVTPLFHKLDKDAEEKVRQLLEHVDAKINDPEKADTEPEWVFWCLFVDAAKIFVELTGKTPTTVYLPFATMGMLQQFVNKFKEPFDVRNGIMGMTVVPGSRSVWFEA